MRAHSSPPQPIVTFPASLLHLRSGNSIQWLNNGIVSWKDTQLNILFLFTTKYHEIMYGGEELH